MNNIFRTFYINLEHRKDRNQQILEELNRMNLYDEKIERFSAVYRPENPCLGCTLSHLNIIKEAKEKNYKNILIFEDDFQFIVEEHIFKSHLDEFFNSNIDFKVLMLSYNVNSNDIKKYNDIVSIANNVDTASGYIVSSKYYDELIECLEYGTMMLEKTNEHWNYINDQIWKKLQLDNKWFIFNTRMGVQRESFSDLKGCVVLQGF